MTSTTRIYDDAVKTYAGLRSDERGKRRADEQYHLAHSDAYASWLAGRRLAALDEADALCEWIGSQPGYLVTDVDTTFAEWRTSQGWSK